MELSSIFSSFMSGTKSGIADIFGVASSTPKISSGKSTNQAVDLINFFSKGPREKAKMPGDTAAANKAAIFKALLDSMDSSNTAMPKQALGGLGSNDIVQQLLNNTFDITKL